MDSYVNTINGRETVRGTASRNCCGVLGNPLVGPMAGIPLTQHSLPSNYRIGHEGDQ